MINDNYTDGSPFTVLKKSATEQNKNAEALKEKIAVLVSSCNKIKRNKLGESLRKVEDASITRQCKSIYQDYLKIKLEFESSTPTPEIINRYVAFLGVFKALIDAGLEIDDIAMNVPDICIELQKWNLVQPVV